TRYKTTGAAEEQFVQLAITTLEPSLPSTSGSRSSLTLSAHPLTLRRKLIVSSFEGIRPRPEENLRPPNGTSRSAVPFIISVGVGAGLQLGTSSAGKVAAIGAMAAKFSGVSHMRRNAIMPPLENP